MDAFNRLKENLAAYDKVAVAYSGGVDSSFLMAAAVEVLGAENVLGIYAENGLNPRRDRFDAYVLAEMMGWQVKVADVALMEDDDVVANDVNRCYYCKRKTFAAAKAFAEENGYEVLLDGTNVDDLSDHRPGFKALVELGVGSPLKEAGITKEMVRKLSKREYDLPTWNKPSNSCLATRIPYGTPLTKEALRLVEEGESYLHELGYLTCRLRLHGDVARVEIPVADFQKFMLNHREDVATYFKELGITYTALDVVGFRSGSGNEGLDQ
ncbi:ATP-dependent sacrificial sulfur transferase LarE [Aedoeadaptatus pacaensis]|uniref:ATP-dependent sacrificial sulfur transferase LarE n=1 Tax=Aedoeadaptatus pacaensis TaxID=1776390 RepID=UPI000838EDD1|nr:ATP-dependent sacrificial sulfur transferase LarE [Peptoniphilus pacaensis]